jgi:hypothetical protein
MFGVNEEPMIAKCDFSSSRRFGKYPTGGI